MASNYDRYVDWTETKQCLLESKHNLEEYALLFENTFNGMEVIHESLDVFKTMYNHGYESGEDTIQPRVDKIDTNLSEIDTTVQAFVTNIVDASAQLVEAIDFAEDKIEYYKALWQEDVRRETEGNDTK